MKILERPICCTFASIVVVLVILEAVPSMGYARYEGCIFGSAESCFFDCKCKDSLCNRTTGSCQPGDSCDVPDKLMRDYYPPEYSSGAACQMGNLAYNMKTLFNIDDLEDAKIIPATAGDFMKDYSNITFDTPREALVVRLPGLSSIKFVEVLLHPEEDANYFKQHFIISLDTVVKEYSSDELGCNVETNPFPLAQMLPHGIKRLSYKCDNPSTGSEVKIAAYSDVSLPFYLPIVRLVAIGHKYIDIDYMSCVEEAGDQQFKWCSICNGAYPPDCKRKCETGHWGENCEQNCPQGCTSGICDLRNGACLCQGRPCQTTETPAEFTKEQENMMNKDINAVSHTSPKVIAAADKENITNGDPKISGNILIGIIVAGVFTVLIALTVGFVCYNKRKHKNEPTSEHLLANRGVIYRHDPAVTAVPNPPPRRSEINGEIYEEIPADHNTSDYDPNTSGPADQNVMPRYSENPGTNSGLDDLASEYMSGRELAPHDSTYLEPRQVGPGVRDDGVQPTTRDPHYQPLGEKTAHPYAFLN